MERLFSSPNNFGHQKSGGFFLFSPQSDVRILDLGPGKLRFFAEFVPFAVREPIRFARDAPAPRSYPVSAARISVHQHREGFFGVQSIQDADYQPRIVEIATATDKNSHVASPHFSIL